MAKVHLNFYVDFLNVYDVIDINIQALNNIKSVGFSSFQDSPN